MFLSDEMFWIYVIDVAEAFEEIHSVNIHWFAKPGYERLMRGARKDGWTPWQTAAYIGGEWGLHE